MSKIVGYWSASTDYLCRHINDETYVELDGCVCYGPDNIEMCLAHARCVIDLMASGSHHISIGFSDVPKSNSYAVKFADYHVLFACEFIGG